jgi:hypothetical protein
MSLWHDLKTVFHLSRAVTVVSARLEELELEWIDHRDALDRLVRQLRTRAQRSDVSQPVTIDSDVQQPEPPATAKDHLRQLARARGML